jgi:hypothetical protein
MPENMEILNNTARTRYGRDLQGAVKRMFINNGQPLVAENDFEGMMRESGLHPITLQSNYDLLSFFLASVAAP